VGVVDARNYNPAARPIAKLSLRVSSNFLKRASPEGGELIPEDIATFLPSGLSIAVATRNAELVPDGARAAAAEVDPDRTHVTVYVPSKAGRRLLGDLEAHPQIAVLFVRPTDALACQLKGTFVGSRPARPAERREVLRQADGYLAELDAIGISRALTAGWSFWPCLALRVRVTDVYQQTPGPGAGAPIA
jgi:hypothetical protein